MDTIAAQATPPGNGGVGIIRVSGSAAQTVAQSVLNKIPRTRFAEYLPFLDANGETIDFGLAIFFKSPHSFTGEDVLEFQGHGGQIVMDLLLKRVLDLGVRLAEPGEFSKRAFLNDKMDLAQAEAVSDLISASSTSAAKSALRSLNGEFSNTVHQLVEQVIELRMFVESAIDFAEEEIDFLDDDKLIARFTAIESRLKTVFHSAQQGVVLNEGMTVVILGQPNAGKSSLLNRLSQRDSAIVTDIAGTTRDVLREHVQLDGLPLHIVDTAGLREQGDEVEREGMRRAWKEVEKSDRVLYLIDEQKGLTDIDEKLLSEIPASLPVTLLFNKIDYVNKQPESFSFKGYEAIRLSALSGLGLDLLSDHLKKVMGLDTTTEGVFSARRRHLDALERAVDSLELAKQQLVSSRAGELVAEELRLTQGALNEITGEFDNEDLLGRIFSSFCIGK